MKIYKLLRYDVKQGFLQNKFKLAGIAGIALVSCIQFYMYKNNFYYKSPAPKGTCMDYLLFLLGGMRKYDPGIESSFIFPVRWLIFHVFVLYATLYYPCRDLLSPVGNVLIIKAQSRGLWWVSKCIWNLLFIISSYMIVFIVNILFCVVAGENISFGITPQLVKEVMGADMILQGAMPALSFYIVLMPMMVSAAISLLEMFFTMLLRPVFSFGILVILLLTSAYWVSPGLIGNYAMPIRSSYLMEQGVSFSSGIIFCSLLSILCVIAGIRYFRKYDILNITEM